MTQPATNETSAPKVPIVDQIAAVDVALRNAVDIRANVVGKTPEFAALADLYDRRIAGLSAAIETLRRLPGNG